MKIIDWYEEAQIHTIEMSHFVESELYQSGKYYTRGSANDWPPLLSPGVFYQLNEYIEKVELIRKHIKNEKIISEWDKLKDIVDEIASKDLRVYFSTLESILTRIGRIISECHLNREMPYCIDQLVEVEDELIPIERK